MKDYILTIGLEIHAELSTETKMFCNSKNDPDENRPNVNVCPVCMGHPGTLPVVNKEAVRSVLRLGLAVGGEIADYTEFDRKNYFYPDIPKGYQISQYQYPLIRGGSIIGVPITRIHLEEDTAKSIHSDNGESLVDFNRAGVPLVELVTEPTIHDPETASKFAREFQLLLTYLGIAHANMEKGEMRVEANISVSKTGEKGTKVEVKNLNSFKAVEKAIRYEMERHVGLLEKGEQVIQETRGWDESGEVTFSQRAKEDSHDYRYFPDPDLPKLFISKIEEFKGENLKESLPELPWERRKRYIESLGLTEKISEVFTRDMERSQALDALAKITSNKEELKLGANYIATDLDITKVAASSILETMRMIIEGTLSSTNAKALLKKIEDKEEDPRKIAEENNLIQESNVEKLKAVAEKVIKDNRDAVAEYKKGKLASLEFLIGQAMKVTKGNANPQVLKEIFTKIL